MGNLVLIGRLLLAVVLGGAVGLERQIHGRPAGLRTHVLVCLGSTLVMAITAASAPDTDPGRAVAGIVTGVGFLGAGVIVKSKDVVRGLTTAACIWFVAGLGIVIGQGFYAMAAASTFVGLAVLVLLDRLAHVLPTANYHTVVVIGRASHSEEIERECRAELGAMGYHIVGMSASLDKSEEQARLLLRLRTRAAARTLEPARRLLAVENVRSVQWD